jgi:formylglycine-generating enzyme required for sulfatase activity
VAVGSLRDHSPEGFNDLGGNAATWVLDSTEITYRDCPEPCVDPVVQTSSEYHGIRGGGWGFSLQSSLSYFRGRMKSTERNYSLTARCARKHKDEEQNK